VGGPKVEQNKSKMAEGRHFKIHKQAYLSNIWTDLHQIWLQVCHIRVTGAQNYIFKKFNMEAAAVLNFQFVAIPRS